MRKHLAPFLEVGLPHRLVDAGNAGIVDEDVDLAECVQRRVARLFHRGRIGDVDLERGDGGADLLRGLLRQRQIVIPDRDLGAGGDKALGDRAPKALRTSGDNGGAAAQIDLVHLAVLLKCPAAVDDMRDAGRECALVAGEIDGKRCDLFRRAEPAHRLARDEHLAAVGRPRPRRARASRASLIVPGQMQLQRMPLVMKSTATDRVSAATAALVAP